MVSRRLRSIGLVTVGLILLALLVVANLRRPGDGEPVETVVAGFGSIVSVVSATGVLRAADQVSLQAQVIGVVKRLAVQEGDFVRPGDVLLELDRQGYEANLAMARARYTQLAAAHARIESLAAAGLAAPEAREASQAALESARAQFLQAEDQYQKAVIRSPIAGTVVKVAIKAGETVLVGTMNNPGSVLMVIADLSRMEAIVGADEADVVNVAVGQPARVEADALPMQSIPGHVVRVGWMPAQDLLSATGAVEGTVFEVAVALDSAVEQLRPGMSVRAEITTASLDSVLVLPAGAVGRRQLEGREQSTVFVVSGGRALLRAVTTGSSSDDSVEIRSGLRPGETVVSGPYKTLARLRDGRRVRPQPVQ